MIVTTPLMRLHIEMLSSACWQLICTAGASGVQGEVVAGLQGCGGSSQFAASVNTQIALSCHPEIGNRKAKLRIYDRL